MRIVTWNVNSVRLRLESLKRLVAVHEPDILCLQEIKVVGELFPEAEIAALGYTHNVVRGQKSYNGVAILSRVPLADSGARQWCEKDDARHAFVTLKDARGRRTEVHNFYVPAGGDEPDPAINDKFEHKLRFLDEMATWFTERRKKTNRFVMVGDLNVAPLETDVWSHKQLLKVVSHTPVEVDAMAKLQASHDWIDAARRIVPPEEQLYSWWSYRSRDWRQGDKGRRLDHIWLTPALAPALKDCRVEKDVRGWEKPSDHAPVILDLDLG